MKFRAMLTGLMAAIGLSEEQLTKAKQVIETVPDVEVGGEGETKTTAKKEGSDSTEVSELKAMLAKQAETIEAMNKRFAGQDAEAEAKAKADRDAAIAAAIDKAKADGRIPAQNAAEVERWTKLLQADQTNAQALLDAMPKVPGKGDDKKADSTAPPPTSKPNSPIGMSVRGSIMQHVNEGLAAAQN